MSEHGHFYGDGANWSPEQKAGQVVASILGAVPQECLETCKRIDDMRGSVADTYRRHSSGELSIGALASVLGTHIRDLCDFHNISLKRPCSEPDQNGGCTQGAVKRLF